MSGCIKEGKKIAKKTTWTTPVQRQSYNQYLPKLTTSCFDHAGKVTRKEIIKM